MTWPAQPPAIPHGAGCEVADQPPIRTTGHLGDPLLRCPSCKATALDAEALDDPATGTGGWRCGEHLRLVVDWRGRGCPACREEHRQREAQRAAKRAARLAKLRAAEEAGPARGRRR